MLDCYSFSRETENIVTSLEEHAINYLIENSYNVIIDSMNLNKQKLQERIDKYTRKWKEQDVELIIEIKNFPIELEEAITRDSLRDFKIGEKVIRQTWNRYKNELIEMLEEFKYKRIEYNLDLSDCVVSDIDGTLAIRGSRNPYDFSRIMEDELNHVVAEHLEFHVKKNRKIIIVSGRDDSCLKETSEWLVKNGINYYALLMRKTGDKRKDSIVKEELYNEFIKNTFNVICIYDDRKQVVDKWRQLGLTVFDVAGNTF